MSGWTSIEAQPDYIPSRLALARLNLRTGELASAAEQISKLEELAPDYPDVLLLKSALAELEGDAETSIELSRRAYEVLPNTNTMLNLSMKYYRQGMIKESVSLQESWVADNPNDISARKILAESYMREQKLDEVIDQYQKILALDDDNMIIDDTGAFDALPDIEPEILEPSPLEEQEVKGTWSLR